MDGLGYGDQVYGHQEEGSLCGCPGGHDHVSDDVGGRDVRTCYLCCWELCDKALSLQRSYGDAVAGSAQRTRRHQQHSCESGRQRRSYGDDVAESQLRIRRRPPQGPYWIQIPESVVTVPRSHSPGQWRNGPSWR